MQQYIFILFYFLTIVSCNNAGEKQKDKTSSPNILLLMSDNQSWNHLGCYGNSVVSTPAIDEIARTGVLFQNAFCSAPSCSPARAAMITGQDIWRLDEAANLWSNFPKRKVFPALLEKAGYQVGVEGKGWGPGEYRVDGWKHNPGGVSYNSLEDFLDSLETDQPWMYWFSSRNPHRPYPETGWEDSGIDPSSIEVPPYLPDVIDVQEDIGDYYNEVEGFDQEVGRYVRLLKNRNMLDNTIVIVCSDNGWQMPRGLANLYDFGTRIPFIVSWPGHFSGGRQVTDFIKLMDLAPTVLEWAGIEVPEEMTGKSFADVLISDKTGQVNGKRDHVIMARERHAYVRSGGLGYPGRALRTKDYLYIRNYEPGRWPAGDPPLFGDVDAHMLHYPSPTKMFMLVNRDDPAIAPLFNLAFEKRPEEELYDLNTDPYQLNNVAKHKDYQNVRSMLATKLTEYLFMTEDPRETDGEFDWDGAVYFKERDKNPRPSENARQKLGLMKEYHY